MRVECDGLIVKIFSPMDDADSFHAVIPASARSVAICARIRQPQISGQDNDPVIKTLQ
jgi:hypothetical protein